MALKDYRVNSVEMKESERPQHRYLVLRKLGQGTYGKVQLALNKETNQEVAIKTIKKAKIENDEDMLRIRREIHIMRAIRHPHIIHINEVFETKQKIVIVMQYASGGELYDYLGCHQTLPEDEARRIFRQIASAIYYCHKNQICHRDLKLENILLDEEGNAQIADFGLSNVFDERRRMNTFCGSPLYASPEIVKGTPYKGPEVDCWSLGVLLYTLIYGTMPFDGRNFKELVSQISEGRYEEPINKSNASNLIRRLLTPDISRRATIIDVCKDNWVNKGYEVSLLEISEIMAKELENNNLKTCKLNLETQAKNRKENLLFRKSGLSSEMQSSERNSASLAKTFEKLTNSIANQTSGKHSLYEQIINYDVRFVINKLISAVEASLPDLREDRKANTAALPKEMEMPPRKIWPRNGELNVSDKVDSAYVIPIFEVTSVVHKSADKAGNHERYYRNFKQNSSQNIIYNKQVTEKLSPKVKASSQNVELRTQFKDTLDQTNTSSITSDIVDFTKRVDHCDFKKSFERHEHQNTNVTSDDVARKQRNDTQNIVQLIEGSNKVSTSQANNVKANDKEHSLVRNSSSKTKRMCDSDLFSQKSHGVSFKAKNHTLSLARILSLNYEKMFRNSFKKQERKKKLPGKISIPATFDPTITPTIVIQREKILLFPTVSVSENKEKIEKKIEKIKKAALNMNLIRRSNTKNRLRIEKYLKSQAKKMQDLACDELRNFANSIEHIGSQHSFSSVSDSCNSMFERGGINTSLGKYVNKELSKILGHKVHNHGLESFNWLNNGDAENFPNDHINQWHLTVPNNFHRWKQCNSDNNLNEIKGHAAIAKSKSEIKLPKEYLNYISFCNTYKNLKKYNTGKCAKNICSNVFSPFTVHTLKNDNHNRRLVRSASDSNSLNSMENLYKCNKDYCRIGKVNLLRQPSPAPISYSLEGKFFHNKLENIFSGHFETHKITTHPHCSNETADCKEHFQKWENSCNERKERNTCITRSMSTNSYMSRAIENPINIRNVEENMLSEPHLKNAKCNNHAYLRNDFMIAQNDINSDSHSCETQDNEKGLIQKGKVREIKRRNTLNGTTIKDKREQYRHSKSEQDECEDFENSLGNVRKEKDYLPAFLKDESQFSSSPNLNHFPLENKINHVRHKDSKSVDSLNISENSFDKALYNGYASDYSPCWNTISDTGSMTLNKNKTSNHIHKILYDHSSIRRNRTKSNSDETLPQTERNDFIRKLQTERKLSFQENTSSVNNMRKTPFKSNFLNELEKREQLIKTPEDVINQRRYPRSSFTIGKRSKSQSRSQSFLQLLSLKRIQEAEKELDKVERNDATVLEEDNSGSLLEALKTHGYKNVISQRFHEEENSFDAFNYKYRGTPFSARNVRIDSPRFNFMCYNTLPRYTPSVNEFDEIDNTRNIFNSGPVSNYEMSYDFMQKTPKSFLYDWLPVDQNESNLAPLNTDQEFTSVTDEKNHSFENDKCCSQWGNENIASSNREESPSEPSNTDQSQDANGGIAQDLSKIRNHLSDYYDIPDFPKSEKIQFSSSSINSEEEREESVQDRIWRKSFYSRFNNSALSRKERSTFLDPEFFSENRTSFLNNIYSPLKLMSQEKNENIDWSDCNKVLQQKRIQAAKKYGTPLDKISPGNSIRRKLTKSLTKENAQDNKELDTEKDIRCNLNIEREEPEPEH